MKPIPTFFLTLVVATMLARAETGVVKADRVNLRAQAKANAEVITQLSKGDRLFILDKRTVPYGNRSMTWLKVSIPDKGTVWVKSDFVKNDTITVEKVNLRAGAGINFSIVGQGHTGDKVQIVRTVGEWHEIRPLPGCYGWVSSDYVDLTPELQAPPPSEQVQPAAPVGAVTPAPTTAGVQVVTQTIATDAAAAKASSAPSETPAATSAASNIASSGKSVTYEGVLHTCAGYLLKRPGTHALWEEGVSKPHIKAYLNSASIPLDRFEGKKVQVIGIETVLINWQNPVVEVQQVQPMW